MIKSTLTFIFTIGILMASTLPPYKSKTLKNGLQIVVIEMRNSSKVITTDVFYKVGSRNEVMGKSGIAHMLEHLNFKSSKNLKSGEFDEIVKSYGGMNNASTGFDYTHYFIKSSTRNLDQSLSLFAELMQNLNLLDEEFQPERNVVAEERRWRTDNNPMGYLYFNLFNNAYVYHPYHWTPIGFMNDIQNWSIDDIKSFHSKYYRPNNAIIVVAGDVSADEVFSSAEKNFGKIENLVDEKENVQVIQKQANVESKDFIPLEKVEENIEIKANDDKNKHFKEPKQNGAKRVIVHKDTEVEMLAIAYHIPDFLHEDQSALTAISELLSSGKSSRLYKVLIHEKQMANQVYAYNMENIDPALFLFIAVANPGVAAEAIEREILTILHEIKTKKVSKEELDKIKINTTSDFVYSLESSSSVADLYGSFLARGSLEPLLTYEDNILKLKPKEIKKIAQKYFKSENSTTIILRKEDK